MVIAFGGFVEAKADGSDAPIVKPRAVILSEIAKGNAAAIDCKTHLKKPSMIGVFVSCVDSKVASANITDETIDNFRFGLYGTTASVLSSSLRKHKSKLTESEIILSNRIIDEWNYETKTIMLRSNYTREDYCEAISATNVEKCEKTAF
jgi:hypothetical protein